MAEAPSKVEQSLKNQETPSKGLKVLRERVIPLVGLCFDSLSQKARKGGDEALLNRRQGAEIEGLLRASHEANLENLKALQNLLTEYLENPSGFEIIDRNDTHRERDDFFIQLRSPSLPSRISEDPNKPDVELYFRLTIERPEETEGRWREALEKLQSAALCRSAESVAPEFDRTLSAIPDEISLTFGAVQSYQAEGGYPKEVFDSGITIGLRGEYCDAYWMVRVGFDDLRSLYPFKKDCLEVVELSTLATHVGDFFPKQ